MLRDTQIKQMCRDPRHNTRRERVLQFLYLSFLKQFLSMYPDHPQQAVRLYLVKFSLLEWAAASVPKQFTNKSFRFLEQPGRFYNPDHPQQSVHL